MTKQGGYSVTWLGHATLLIQSPSGKRILIDPWFADNPAVPEDRKSIEALQQVDIVLLSHGHFDHIGELQQIAERYSPTFVAILELANWLGNQGIEGASPMNLGGSQEVDGITFTMIPAWHSTGIPDADGNLIYGGTACGFVITFENGHRIYYTGDTAVSMDMKLYGDIYKPELLIMPIGDYFTMGPEGAAVAAEMVHAPKVLPVHYGTFPVLTGTPEKLRDLLSDTVIDVLDCKPGETLSF